MNKKIYLQSEHTVPVYNLCYSIQSDPGENLWFSQRWFGPMTGVLNEISFGQKGFFWTHKSSAGAHNHRTWINPTEGKKDVLKKASFSFIITGIHRFQHFFLFLLETTRINGIFLNAWCGLYVSVPEGVSCNLFKRGRWLQQAAWVCVQEAQRCFNRRNMTTFCSKDAYTVRARHQSPFLTCLLFPPFLDSSWFSSPHCVILLVYSFHPSSSSSAALYEDIYAF